MSYPIVCTPLGFHFVLPACNLMIVEPCFAHLKYNHSYFCQISIPSLLTLPLRTSKGKTFAAKAGRFFFGVPIQKLYHLFAIDFTATLIFTFMLQKQLVHF